MKSLIQLKQPGSRSGLLILLLVTFFALSPMAQAVSPAPGGGYPGGNTAAGQNALLSLTTGTFNTAVGFLSLRSNTEGQFNTAIGAGALLANEGNSTAGEGIENTATGTGALLSNATGAFNSAHGAFALFSNTIGNYNTAIGESALFRSTEGDQNTACGTQALLSNTTGAGNTATGTFALFSNTTGDGNTVIGVRALSRNTEGTFNTATGAGALFNNTTGNGNTASGEDALVQNSSGENNTALGAEAGQSLTTGSGNVFVGAGMDAVNGNEMDHTYIRNINTTAVSGGSSDFVTVDLTTGLVGHASSSQRYKEEIRPINDDSEALYRLKPVSYRYKKHIDPTQSPAFGLVAEEVAEVNTNLVARDSQGRPESVHYEMINAMLLNEFLKEHRKNEAQQGKIGEQDVTMSQLKSTLTQQQKRFDSKLAQQERQIAALTADLQRLAADIELNKAEAGALAEK